MNTCGICAELPFPRGSCQENFCSCIKWEQRICLISCDHPSAFSLLPAFHRGHSVMSQCKMTSTPKPFFTGLIVQCFERNYFLIPVGIHESLETLMSFPLAQVKAGTANPLAPQNILWVFCIFGIWIILPPGPTASCKSC